MKRHLRPALVCLVGLTLVAAGVVGAGHLADVLPVASLALCILALAALWLAMLGGAS